MANALPLRHRKLVNLPPYPRGGPSGIHLILPLLTMFGSTCYVYYKLRKFFYFISILTDSEILDQLTNLEKNVDSEVTKPKIGRKKKTDPKINEVEENDVREKREKLVACFLSGNSKTFLEKDYTEQQINEIDTYTVSFFQMVLNIP